MSDYHDPSYQADPLQGHQAPAGDEGYGQHAAGYEEEPVYGDQGAYQEDVAYGDAGTYQEEVVYGDGGAYQEEAAYGDEGAYQDDVAHGDAGPARYEGTYQDDVSYGDAGGYGEAGEAQEAYAEQGYEYAEDYAEDGEDEPPVERAPAKPVAARKKLLIGSVVGLALIGLMGAGSYMFLLAPEAGGASFDLGGLMRMIPFLGAQETEETLAANQANVLAVKKAIDTFAKKNGRLPISAEEVQAQLKATGWVLSNPYDLEQAITIEYAEVPTVAGAVAFVPEGAGYTVRVGDVTGAPLTLDGAEYVVRGRPPALASKPPVASPRGQKPAKQTSTAEPAAKPGRKGASAPAAPPAPAAPEAPAPEANEAPIAAATAPAPTPAGISPAQRLERNREFDQLRNRGISLVYEKRTAEAVVAFKKALALRPGDATVTRWLQTIQGVIDTHTATEKARYDTQALQMKPQPHHAPALPPDPVRAAEKDTERLLEEIKRRELERRDPKGAPELPPPRLE